jgi:5-methylcytosine-specific restriction protein A
MPKPLDVKQRNREHDARRRTAQPWRALYKTARWLHLREAQLFREPLCQRCKGRGVVRIAEVVHHKVAHKGNHELFFDAGNLASSCKPCHDSTEQVIEVRGFEMGCDVAGRPLDKNHPWNKVSKHRPGG